jgi:hypothetical protein
MSITSLSLDQRGCLSILEFVQWSGLSRSLVYEQVRAGRLATTKVGRRTVISMSEARRFVQPKGE